jgi:hypothetical protein
MVIPFELTNPLAKKFWNILIKYWLYTKVICENGQNFQIVYNLQFSSEIQKLNPKPNPSLTKKWLKLKKL